LETYRKAGRWIVRAFGPWLDTNEAFHLGLAEDGLFEIEETGETSDMYVHSFASRIHLPPKLALMKRKHRLLNYIAIY